MMRFCAAVLAAFVFLGVGIAATEIDLESREPLGPSWMILEKEGCSGVHIGGGLVITANHCISSKYESEIYELLWTSKDYDTALLSAKEPLSRQAATLACRPVKIGEAIYTMTFPITPNSRVSVRTEGVIGSDPVGKIMYWHGGVIANVSASNGSSGGAVYAKNGQLIGIVVGGASPWSSMTIIIPSSTLCRLLGRA